MLLQTKYFFFFSGLPVHTVSKQVLHCFALTSAKLVTTCTSMFSVPFRNKIFITHLQKYTQAICMVFTGDVGRFENTLHFPCNLHR